MNEPTFVPVPKSSRYPCEHETDPESWAQCGVRATVRFRVYDPRRDYSWWSYACTPEHARGVAAESTVQGYEFPKPKEG